MMTLTISDLQKQVYAEKADAKFNYDMDRNMQVIKMRMHANSKAKFALYDGGDAYRMEAELRSRGLSTATVDFHGTIWAQL